MEVGSREFKKVGSELEEEIHRTEDTDETEGTDKRQGNTVEQPTSKSARRG